jgi:sporulation protein YlmC with PRC-barrel domain
MKDHSSNLVKSSEVVGVAVKSSKKESLGEIKDIALDKISGQVRYVVLSFSRLFMSNKYFALPWKKIHYSPEDQCFILDEISQAKLKEEDGFDKDHWPDMAQWPEMFKHYEGDL